MDTKTLKKKCVRAGIVLEAIENLTEQRKKFYEEHDELVTELREVAGLESHGLRVTSPFSKGNTQWGHGPVREYVLERVENKPSAKK